MAASRQYHIGISKNGFHQLSYLDWGIPDNLNSMVICAHGLSRNA